MSFVGTLIKSAIVGRNCFKPARITRAPITEWREAGSLEAGSDVYSTPFGNVGQYIGYKVKLGDSDVVSRAYDQHILKNLHPRLAPQYTMEETGPEVIHVVDDDFKKYLEENGIPL